MPDRPQIDLDSLLKNTKGSEHLDALFSSFAQENKALVSAKEKAEELYPDDKEKQEAFLQGVQFNMTNPTPEPTRRAGFQPNP